MINNQTITAVIPVRAGSKRLPNKNILPFGNTNLLVHKIRQLLQVPFLDFIMVSSDSEEMLAMADAENQSGQAIRVLTHKRALEYCDEKTKTFNEVVEHVVQNTSTDHVMWAPCVCPLTTPENYTNAISTYMDVVLFSQKYDSVISAKRFKEYLFDEKGPHNWDPCHHIPSQQLPEWKTIVNGFYIAPREKMIEWKYLYGKNPFLYVLTKKEAVDIDDAEDFAIAKALLNIE